MRTISTPADFSVAIRAATRRGSIRWAGFPLLFLACVLVLDTARAAAAEPDTASNPGKDPWGDPLPPGAVSRLGTTRWRFPYPVELVQFLPGGRELLSCCGDGLCRVCDAATGKQIRCFGKADGCLEVVSRNGKALAQASPDGMIHVWDVTTGKETSSFDSGAKRELRGLSFINDEQLIGLMDLTTIKVWDIKKGKLAYVLREEETAPTGFPKRGLILQFAVSPDGSTLAFTMHIWLVEPERVTLNTWHLQDNKLLGEVEVAKNWPEVHNISPVFSPDGRSIAWSEPKGAVHLFQADNLKKVRSLDKGPRDEPVFGMAFSADGRSLVLAGESQIIRIFDVKTGKQLREIGEEWPRAEIPEQKRYLSRSLRCATCTPFQFSWSPDSKRIAQAWGRRVIRGAGSRRWSGHRPRRHRLPLRPPL